ncbi:hypothetical protein, partial [Streptomyces cacaoi]
SLVNQPGDSTAQGTKGAHDMGDEPGGGKRAGEAKGTPAPGMKPGGHIPPDNDLVHSESQKKAAARYLRETLGPDAHKDGSKADADTETLVGNPQSPTGTGEFHGWEIWTGIRHRLGEWKQHHKQLVQRLTQEHDALGDAGKLLGNNDIRTSQRMGKLSPTSGFKSRLDDL